MTSRLLPRLIVLVIAVLAVIRVDPVYTQSSPASDPPSRSWKRIRSQSFTAIGDASERVMRDALRELEAHRLARLALTPWLVPERPEDVTLVVLDERSDLARFTRLDGLNRPERAQSFTLLADAHSYVIVSTDVGPSREAAFGPALREYTAHLLSENLPGVPFWLRVSLLDVFASYVPREPTGDRAIGRPPPELRQAIDHLPLQPLATVVNATGWPAPVRYWPFRVTAWRLAHYLLLGPPERTRQLPRYLALLEGGMASGDAFTTAFEVRFEDFHAELARHTDSPAWLVSPEALQTAVAAGSVEPLRESEVAALRGAMFALAGRDEQALKELDAALAFDPQGADARLAKALVLGKQGRDVEAFALIDGIDNAVPSSLTIHLALGRALYDLGRYPEALEHYRQAVALNPRSLPAWSGLSVSATGAGLTTGAGGAATSADRLSSGWFWRYRRSIALMRVPKAEPEIIRDVRHILERADAADAAYPVFLAVLAHRRLGQDAEAEALLADVAAQLERNSWPWRIASFLQGRLPASSLLSDADNDGQRTEAHAYIGLVSSTRGRVDEAMPHFRWVIDHRLRNFTEYDIVSNELRRLGVQTAQ